MTSCDTLRYACSAEKTLSNNQRKKSIQNTAGIKENVELYKMYRTIIDLHEDKGTLDKDVKKRLVDKGKKVKETMQFE